MLFAVDVGNTNLTLGVYRHGELVSHWRLETDAAQTVDGWGVLFRNLFSLAKLDIHDIDDIIISSVVPQLDSSLEKMAQLYFHAQPLFVTASVDTGLLMKVDMPLCPASGSVLAVTMKKSEYSPSDINCFLPLIVHPVEFLSALVLIAAASDPASGSVKAMEKTFSPITLGNNQRSTCS